MATDDDDDDDDDDCYDEHEYDDAADTFLLSFLSACRLGKLNLHQTQNLVSQRLLKYSPRDCTAVS